MFVCAYVCMYVCVYISEYKLGSLCIVSYVYFYRTDNLVLDTNCYAPPFKDHFSLSQHSSVVNSFGVGLRSCGLSMVL